MPRTLFMILFFGCFGITAEIFFTAFVAAFEGTSVIPGDPVMSLTGKTYVWMFPIYALIPFLGGWLFEKLQSFFWIFRLLMYAAGILTVEFISGFLLDQLTGKCPWEYTTGWHVMGYIRLDYTPAWMFFSFCIEYLYHFIDRRF